MPAISDVIGGKITIAVASESLPYVKDGRLKALAVSSLSPTPLAPEVPPLSRSIEGIDIVAWFGIFAPTGTAPEIVERLNAEVAAAVKSEEITSNLDALGPTPVGRSAGEFAQYYKAELNR